jgi:hypothetical protein
MPEERSSTWLTAGRLLHECAEPRPLPARMIRPPLQEQPSRLGQERLAALFSEGTDLRATHLMIIASHVLGDVKDD